MSEQEYAVMIFDPLKGPMEKGHADRMRHTGQVIDRTKIENEGIDIDLWHPGDNRWFRYARMKPEDYEGDYESGECPEVCWAAQFYPTKARFVEGRTGLVLKEKPIDKDRLLEKLIPKPVDYIQMYKALNRKERREALRQREKEIDAKMKEIDRRLKRLEALENATRKGN